MQKKNLVIQVAEIDNTKIEQEKIGNFFFYESEKTNIYNVYLKRPNGWNISTFL